MFYISTETVLRASPIVLHTTTNTTVMFFDGNGRAVLGTAIVGRENLGHLDSKT